MQTITLWLETEKQLETNFEEKIFIYNYIIFLYNLIVKAK